MRRIHVLVVFATFILIAPMLGILAPITNVSEKTNASDEPGPVHDLQIAGAFGEDHLVTNVAENPSFEVVGNLGQPADWGYYSTSYKYQNITYQDDVYADSYSALIRAKGEQQSTQAYINQFMPSEPNRPHINEGITLDFFWKAASMPTLQGSNRLYVYFQLHDSVSGQYRDMYYVLLYGNWYPGNGTNYVYVMDNGTVGSWNNGFIDVTAAYTESFGAPTSTAYVRMCYFYAVSDQGETDFVDLLIDNTQLRNSTSYNFLQNSDFEGVGMWSYSNEAPGYIMATTALKTDGERSMNLTVASMSHSSSSYAFAEEWIGYYEGLAINAPGEGSIEFDWMYSDVAGGGTGQQSHFVIYFENLSYYCQIIYHLGSDTDFFSYTNSTYQKHIMTPGFGTRDVWHHFAVDLYELVIEFNLTIGVFDDMYWDASSGSQENSSLNLFVDDFKLITYPAYDPGFEQDWYWSTGNSIVGWYRTGSSYPYQNITTDSHSGDFAANLTVWEGPETSVYRSQFVPLSPNHYTDFWWRLDYVNGESYAIGEIRLEFETDSGDDFLHYVLGASAGSGFTNQSNHVYYLVDEFNQPGVWTNLVRNPWNDLTDYYGSKQWNLTQIRMNADSSLGSNISILFDDMHFVVDTHAPVISSVTRETASPMYYDPVLISAQATDIALDKVMLAFNNGSWYSVEMIYTGARYEAWITPAPYGTDVAFAVVANDTGGLLTWEDNSGLDYHYTPSDDVNPTVVIDLPWEDQVIDDQFSIEVTVDDPDAGSSGVDYVEIWDGSTLLGTIPSSPWVLDVDSWLLVNGTHNIQAIVYDVAGNSDSDDVTITVDNDVIGPVISDVIQNPEIPTYNLAVEVSVVVTDYTAIDNVTLYLSVDGDTWIPIEMTRAGILFTAEIWGRPWGVEIDYYIVAYDTYGQSTMVGNLTDPLGYVVEDHTTPVLSVSGPSMSEILSGTAQFYVSASDAGSGIANYIIELDGVTVVSEAATVLVNEVFNLDTLTLENGIHTISFIVSDNAGMIIVFEFEYTVHNPVGLEGIVSALGDIMAQYGFIIGAGTAVVLLIVIQILLRKRRAA